MLVRPTEWPSKRPIVCYHDFTYQAQSWSHSRRVVAKVEWHQGELFPRLGFIVTNLSYPPKGIVRFYNGRGTAEQWITEGKNALNWTRLSCHKFVANQVRLRLFVLTYNLGNLVRRLALPEAIKRWSLTSLQTRLIKPGYPRCRARPPVLWRPARSDSGPGVRWGHRRPAPPPGCRGGPSRGSPPGVPSW